MGYDVMGIRFGLQAMQARRPMTSNASVGDGPRQDDGGDLEIMAPAGVAHIDDERSKATQVTVRKHEKIELELPDGVLHRSGGSRSSPNHYKGDEEGRRLKVGPERDEVRRARPPRASPTRSAPSTRRTTPPEAPEGVLERRPAKPKNPATRHNADGEPDGRRSPSFFRSAG